MVRHLPLDEHSCTERGSVWLVGCSQEPSKSPPLTLKCETARLELGVDRVGSAGTAKRIQFFWTARSRAFRLLFVSWTVGLGLCIRISIVDFQECVGGILERL